MIRSKIDWWKKTVLTRSSGISIPCLDTTPLRYTTRSVVMTKLIVDHLA